MVVQDARARDEAEREDRHRSEQLADACTRIEEELEVLKSRYELFFLGIDRRAPARDRDEMKRRVARIKGEFTRNTGLRFRIEAINARFLAYDRMWTRSAREKEEGTYRRDLLRARRHGHAAAPSPEKSARGGVATGRPAQAGAPAPAEPAVAPVAAKPESPSVPPRAAAPPGTSAGSGGISPEQLRSLYSAYVDAKQRCNEDVSRLSYDALAATIAKQVPELIARYQARAVEFKVVIKDGRAVLKAVPRV